MYPFLVRTEMPIFYYISRHSAPGALCRHHHSATFPTFLPLLKEDTHQQAKKKVIQHKSDPTAAGGNNVYLDITAPTLTEKTATDLCSFAII